MKETSIKRVKNAKWKGKWEMKTLNQKCSKSWPWLRGGHLKRETETLVMSRTSRTINAKIEKTQKNSKCCLYGGRYETLNYINNECKRVTFEDYKNMHDRVARVICWELCKGILFPQFILLLRDL